MVDLLDRVVIKVDDVDESTEDYSSVGKKKWRMVWPISLRTVMLENC